MRGKLVYRIIFDLLNREVHDIKTCMAWSVYS